MRISLRAALDRYLDRRTSTGIPWWVFAVSLAVANGVRQLVMWRVDAGDAMRVTSFVLMVALVVAAVHGVATIGRRPGRSDRSPTRAVTR